MRAAHRLKDLYRNRHGSPVGPLRARRVWTQPWHDRPVLVAFSITPMGAGASVSEPVA